MVDREGCEAFIEAMSDLIIACERMGIKPPNGLTFQTGKGMNAVGDQLTEMRIAMHDAAVANVFVDPISKRVSVCGLTLKVAY